MIKRFNYIDGKINKINSRYYYTHFKKKNYVNIQKHLSLYQNKLFYQRIKVLLLIKTFLIIKIFIFQQNYKLFEKKF